LGCASSPPVHATMAAAMWALSSSRPAYRTNVCHAHVIMSMPTRYDEHAHEYMSMAHLRITTYDRRDEVGCARSSKVAPVVRRRSKLHLHAVRQLLHWRPRLCMDH